MVTGRAYKGIKILCTLLLSIVLVITAVPADSFADSTESISVASLEVDDVVLLEGVGGIPMVCGKTTHSKVSLQMVEPRWLGASPRHSAALQDMGPPGTVCPSQCLARSHQAGGWTGRGPHLPSRRAPGQWPPSRNSCAPDQWVTASPSLTGDLRFSG